MEWKLTDDRPIWSQLSALVASQIAAGVYGPGERLPSVRELAAEGAVDGIEVYHPSNSPEDSAECLALCKQYGLVATAGTDFHGRNHKHPHPIGTCTAPDEAAAQLRAIAEKRKRERT